MQQKRKHTQTQKRERKPIETRSLTPMEQAVMRGAALLDEKDPHWWEEDNTLPPVLEGMIGTINLKQLRMQSGQYCILGQRYKSNVYPHYQYQYGLKALGLRVSSDTDGVDTDGIHYGFNLNPVDQREYGDREYSRLSRLTELWVSVISARREAKRANQTETD